MSISAMKQALEALTYIYTETTEYEEKVMDEAVAVLEQAIAEAEKPWVKTYCGRKPNYTTQEKREWVGLTDEEVADYWVAAFNENGLYVQTFAKIIEAKLKEKNYG